MTAGVGNTLTMGYDGLRRLTSVTGGPVSRQFTYRDIDSTKTTMQVASVTSGVQQYGYTYDSMGNIATYSAPGKATVTYTYDNQGQLLSAVGDNTYTYTYDGAGNILTASDGVASHTYTYGDSDWKDLLTAFDGQAITYDTIGNPTSYYNGTRWNFTWANGQSLATASDGTNSLSFAYDASGLRTSKVVNGTTYRYYYAGGKLMRMTWGSNTIDFFYDASGLPYAMKYDGAVYYYVTNLQGDVMYIMDANQNGVASYDYDPYGKVISAMGILSDVNPLRYCGYVYDQETGFYYLQSRYYDPATGRFLNVDSYVSTGQGIIGYNTFVYCLNSPISYVDSTGMLAFPGEIHNDVVQHIAQLYNYNKEQIIIYQGGGFGRADLISDDGYVWDVKRNKPRQISAGKRQVEKYVNNTWYRHEDIKLEVGKNEIEPGFFYHKNGLTTYKVSYWFAGDGVIAYDYRASEFDYQTLASTALVVTAAIALGVLSGLPSATVAYVMLA